MATPRPCAFPVLVLLLLAGCGGSGGGSGASSRASSVSIDWPARSRTIGAPASADLARIVLTKAGATSAVAILTASRPAGQAASRQTYAFAERVPAGNYGLAIDFHAGATADVPSVGRASLSVKVDSHGRILGQDGLPLHDIALTGKVVEVRVATEQEFIKGTTDGLQMGARTNAAEIAVNPRAVVWRVVDGTSLVANGDGTLTGKAEGPSTVVAAVDGVESLPQVVNVLGAPLATRTIPLHPAEIVYDGIHDRFWASLGEINGGSVVELDPATGTAGRLIAVGNDPSALAISGDASTLYVGLRGDGTILPIDLATSTRGTAFPLQSVLPGAFASQLAVAPGDPKRVVATIRSGGLFDASMYVYENGAPLYSPETAPLGYYSVWDSATRLISHAGSGYYLASQLGPGGLTVERSVTGTDVSFHLPFVLSDGRIYTNEQIVLDSGTLEQVGRFATYTGAPGLQQIIGPAVDARAGLAYYIENDQRGGLLRVYRTSDFTLLTSRRVVGFPTLSGELGEPYRALYRWGASGLALNTSQGVLLIDGAPVESGR